MIDDVLSGTEKYSKITVYNEKEHKKLFNRAIDELTQSSYLKTLIIRRLINGSLAKLDIFAEKLIVV